MIKLMLEMNSSKKLTALSLVDTIGQTPLHQAAALDRVAALEFLVEQVYYPLSLIPCSLQVLQIS
jgi:ankyrin repeat protein